mgnify:CR=1 FL=1
MKQYFIYCMLTLLLPFAAISQNGTVQNAAIPKDAPVNVTMTDFKDNVLNNEIVVIKRKRIPGLNR